MSILAKKMALLHNHLETFNFVGAAKIKKNYIFNILDRAILTPLKNSIENTLAIMLSYVNISHFSSII